MKTVDASLFSMLCKNKDKQSPSDESEDLGDILDSEVKFYLNNKKEAHYKKIIWEKINKDYLQEQAAKKQGSEVAGAVVKKAKKRQRQKEAATNNPTQVDTEATHEMLAKKRLSSKVNFDVLDKLFSDTPASGSNKKQGAASCEQNGSSSGQSHCREQLEDDLEDSYPDVVLEEEVDIEHEEDPSETYGNEYYDFENEEEYGYSYNDYGEDGEY